MRPGIYEHYKGNRYELLFTVTHSETLEEMVCYRALYGEGKRWVRPVSMWDETVLVDGKEMPRFRFVGEAEA